MRNRNKNLRLLAICNYPSDTRPVNVVFVRALLLELAVLGIDITVLAPEPLNNLTKASTGFRLAPRHEIRDGIAIYRPRYMRYSNIDIPFGGTTKNWSDASHVKAALREVQKLSGSFDLCYAHFLYPQGLAAAQVGDLLGIPAVTSLGESSFNRYAATYSNNDISHLLAKFSGVLANSFLIKEYCIQHFGLREDNIEVLPNGVNEKLFFPRERKAARKQCKLPQDRPIVVFVGQLIERKGPLRVLEAIQPWPEVGAVFLGQGPQVPRGPQVLFQGAVAHEDVPIWLSAADIFVLPTLDEGCSNAILEALFCGLPIVSSALPFNHDILDDQVAILVDPGNVTEIGQAVFSLVNNPEQRTSMHMAAMEHSRNFRLGDRAKRINAYLNTFC
ncbi:MAG: glycosyltransferase [Candidatus Promineifilaceae bacterium]|nr:glycosyltransferase [Candidatus Promineifilaceae bacterium]